MIKDSGCRLVYASDYSVFHNRDTVMEDGSGGSPCTEVSKCPTVRVQDGNRNGKEVYCQSNKNWSVRSNVNSFNFPYSHLTAVRKGLNLIRWLAVRNEQPRPGSTKPLAPGSVYLTTTVPCAIPFFPGHVLEAAGLVSLALPFLFRFLSPTVAWKKRLSWLMEARYNSSASIRTQWVQRRVAVGRMCRATVYRVAYTRYLHIHRQT